MYTASRRTSLDLAVFGRLGLVGLALALLVRLAVAVLVREHRLDRLAVVDRMVGDGLESQRLPRGGRRT